MTWFNKHRFNKYFGPVASWQFVVVNLMIMACFQLLETQSIRYQADWIQQFEPWRLITAHWVHFNWQHLALNGFGLVLCVAIAKPVWSVSRWITYNLFDPAK